VVRNVLHRGRRTTDAGDAAVENPTVDERDTDTRVVRAREPVRTEPVRTREPVTERVEPEPVTEAPRWARTSMFATLGLVVGLAALFATLTGLLAAVGVALGVVGGAIAAGGLVGASRRGVTGHSVALLGLMCSLVAIVLGVLAISGNLSWLDSKTDEVARLRDWLDAHISWFKHW
jgi:hypothetical protein